MIETIVASGPLRGVVTVPGDKSITHRALLFGLLADGDTVVRGYLEGGDCQASVDAVRSLGGVVEEIEPGTLQVTGVGLRGIHEPEDVINCVGSGTTMRLLAGLVAGYPMTTVLSGNQALRRRPMDRVALPLRQMGATVMARGERLPPLTVRGGGLQGITYHMPQASAQVKSAVLLAGLNAAGTTTVLEPGPTRDHTELMLRAMGADVRVQGRSVTIAPADRLTALDVSVPGDLSSAAFILAAAVLVPGSEVTVAGVGVNSTRAGILTILEKMGADVEVENRRESGGEPVADVTARHSSLRGVEVGGDLIPLSIDELPLVAILASQAKGTTTVRDAAELRVKESDRVDTVVREMSALGMDITARLDGFEVRGGRPLRGARVGCHRDHRLAMCLAVAGLLVHEPVEIDGAECAADSFPGFFPLLRGLTQ